MPWDSGRGLGSSSASLTYSVHIKGSKVLSSVDYIVYFQPFFTFSCTQTQRPGHEQMSETRAGGIFSVLQDVVWLLLLQWCSISLQGGMNIFSCPPISWVFNLIFFPFYLCSLASCSWPLDFALCSGEMEISTISGKAGLFVCKQ